MDLTRFTEDSTVTMVKQFDAENINPFFRVIESNTSTTVRLQTNPHSSLVNLGSNNYLGLTHHPYVQDRAIEAIRRFGTGCTGSRFLNGNFTLHKLLEQRLASYLGYEAVLLFSTGMQANLGSLNTLPPMRSIVFCDSNNHASILDGLRRDAVIKFKHRDYKALQQSLEDQLTLHPEPRYSRFIVSDGVFSMEGHIADLKTLNNLSNKYNAPLYIDDAHGLGVLGHHGKGTHDFLGAKPDFLMGTFSKSFASLGGFLASSKEAINYVKLHARSLIFSASLPPSVVATVLACLDIVEEDHSLQTSLFHNVQYMHRELLLLGYKDQIPEKVQTAIIPIYFHSNEEALRSAKFLQENKVFATPVIHPATSTPLIRTSYTATHTKYQLDKCLEAFGKLKKELRKN